VTTFHPDPERPSFSVDFTIRDDVIALHGYLDIDSAPTLEAALDFVDDATGELVLDLTDLQFNDSTGLSRLVKVHRRLETGGGGLVIRHARPHVRKLFAISGLATVFAIEP
jgi:anti-sigma B factor antagonist